MWNCWGKTLSWLEDILNANSIAQIHYTESVSNSFSTKKVLHKNCETFFALTSFYGQIFFFFAKKYFIILVLKLCISAFLFNISHFLFYFFIFYENCCNSRYLWRNLLLNTNINKKSKHFFVLLAHLKQMFLIKFSC